MWPFRSGQARPIRGPIVTSRLFAKGAVVRLPFPYTERSTRQHRPALVLGAAGVGSEQILLVAMITSAENRSWPGDVLVRNLKTAGLPAPSVVRPCKIATVDAAQAEVIGAVTARVRQVVDAALRVLLDL